uniref:C2 domain-containing protein n=2 Tax=Salmonidae TaxID=8015 RepID=A0A8C7J8Z6_ONCKI
MAVEEEGLRVFQSVKIKIGEAKNIPPYPGPNRMRDCYCTVNLDQEEVFRTKIIEKSLCPFYGEDFYCEIPRSFRHLSFYIFDRDVFRRDSSIGESDPIDPTDHVKHTAPCFSSCDWTLMKP